MKVTARYIGHDPALEADMAILAGRTHTSADFCNPAYKSSKGLMKVRVIQFDCTNEAERDHVVAALKPVPGVEVFAE